MGRRTVKRGSLLVVACLQLALPGAAALADARLDGGAPRGLIHLESHATQACVPVHPADCVLHRFLSTLGRVGQGIPVSVRSSARHPLAPKASALALSTQQQRLPDSRAPPPSS